MRFREARLGDEVQPYLIKTFQEFQSNAVARGFIPRLACIPSHCQLQKGGGKLVTTGRNFNTTTGESQVKIKRLPSALQTRNNDKRIFDLEKIEGRFVGIVPSLSKTANDVQSKCVMAHICPVTLVCHDTLFCTPPERIANIFLCQEAAFCLMDLANQCPEFLNVKKVARVLIILS